jgi:hypothetical protein
MTSEPAAFAPPQILGLSHLAQLLFDAVDIAPLWNQLIARATAEPADPGALFDLSVLLLLSGQADQGLAVQAQALEMSPLYRRIHGDGSGLRVLAIFTPGGMMANTPLDFLLGGSDIRLDMLYIGQGVPLPADIPDHDVAFLAIGESSANVDVLSTLGPALAAWPKPMINAAPDQIAGLTRDGVVAMFADSAHIVAPATSRLDRRHVEAIAGGAASLDDHLPGAEFPIIIRPIDSHAGQALEKIDSVQALGAYLAANDPAEFYISAFVDYSGPDGLFRKQRIAFFQGVPYVSHMAVSSHWMVHYLSAEMAERPERRAEEAALMAEFDDSFAVRHAAAFAEMHAAFGLDYFAIDCAETRDGRLLLFEADVAMIIHAMDGEELYPYKKPAMAKLFGAFQAMLARAAAGAQGSASIAA